MSARITSFRLFGNLILVFMTLFGGVLLANVPGAPAPQSSPHALLYLPKKTSQYETTQYRRSQLELIKKNSAPFVLFWAIRTLKNTELLSLPKKGKGGENRHHNEEDISWLAQNLKVEYLDGTGVLRISLAVGSIREQALLVNAVVQAYFKLGVGDQRKSYENSLVVTERRMEALQQSLRMANGAEKKSVEQSIVETEASIKSCEDALRTLPRLLDLAEVPPE